MKLLLVIISISIISCGRKPQEEASAEMFNPAFLQNIEIAPVSVQNVERQLRLTGKVEYDQDRVIRYISLVSGRVVSTHFHLGDRVERGQTMAVIRSAELSDGSRTQKH